MLWQFSISVSYTHLDVYKRQHISHLPNFFMCTNLSVSQPVSFTNMNVMANNLFGSGALPYGRTGQHFR